MYYPAFVIPDDANRRYSSVIEVPETTTLFGMTIGKKYYEDALSLDINHTINNYKKDVLIIHVR